MQLSNRAKNVLAFIGGFAVVSLLFGAATGITTNQTRTAAPSTAQTPDLANAEGTSLSHARADHVHNITAASAGASPNAGNTSTEGTDTNFGRADHTHACTSASATQVGCADTTTQTFAGNKTFTGLITGQNTTLGLTAELSSANPGLTFTESDVAGADGDWRFRGGAGTFNLDRNTAAGGDWTAYTTPFSIASGSDVLVLSTPLPVGSGGTGASNTATSGRYLKGDGTDFVTSNGSASGTGACGARTAATTLNSDAIQTCTEFVDIASTQAAISGAKTFLTSVAIGLTTDDATLTSNRVSTGSDQFGLVLQHTDSNTAGDTTLGIGIQFSLEDGGSVMNESGSIMSEWTAATAGAEYADLIFRVTRNGTTGVEAMRTERGSLQVHGYLELEAAAPTSTGNPLANSIGLYVREDISCGGAAAADCCLRARTSGGAEATVAVVVTDAGCP